MKRPLLRSSAFIRAARRLVRKNPRVVRALRETLEFLAHDAFDPRLQTHKLKGKLKNRWACSAGYDLRVVFRFVEHGGSEAILLLTVGTHEEVY